jgi:hypothetical protein
VLYHLSLPPAPYTDPNKELFLHFWLPSILPKILVKHIWGTPGAMKFQVQFNQFFFPNKESKAAENRQISQREDTSST